MYYTDDPLRDFERYDSEREKVLENLPRCSCCNQPIQQEKAVYYNDQWCCKDCEVDFWDDIRSDFLESVNDYG